MLLKDKLDIGHSFLEGDPDTICLAGGTGPDTSDNDGFSPDLYQLGVTIMGLQHPVYIMEDFKDLFFDIFHPKVRV